MSAAENKAVFLSYASQDAEEARRIAEALRGAGVEVWFDQNELTGGDAWDAKIRKQIAECALFVPVISANTQARLEGYFRLAWKLAAQRTHTMAEEKTFLLPVVIDGTRDAEAKVPAEFKAVQWTRIPGGESSQKFCERVGKLLGGGSGTGLRPVSGTHGPAARAATPALSRVPGRRWLAVAAAAAVSVALGIGGWQVFKAVRPTLRPANAQAAELVARAWEQLNRPAMGRASLTLAGELCLRATTLDPDNADAWAAWSQVETWHVYLNFDHTPGRALALQPHSVQARSGKAQALAASGRLAEAVALVQRGASAGETGGEEMSSTKSRAVRYVTGQISWADWSAQARPTSGLFAD